MEGTWRGVNAARILLLKFIEREAVARPVLDDALLPSTGVRLDMVVRSGCALVLDRRFPTARQPQGWQEPVGGSRHPG